MFRKSGFEKVEREREFMVRLEEKTAPTTLAFGTLVRLLWKPHSKPQAACLWVLIPPSSFFFFSRLKSSYSFLTKKSVSWLGPNPIIFLSGKIVCLFSLITIEYPKRKKRKKRKKKELFIYGTTVYEHESVYM